MCEKNECQVVQYDLFFVLQLFLTMVVMPKHKSPSGAGFPSLLMISINSFSTGYFYGKDCCLSVVIIGHLLICLMMLSANENHGIMSTRQKANRTSYCMPRWFDGVRIRMPLKILYMVLSLVSHWNVSVVVTKYTMDDSYYRLEIAEASAIGNLIVFHSQGCEKSQ